MTLNDQIPGACSRHKGPQRTGDSQILLDGNGYPPVNRNEIQKKTFEQAKER